MKKLSTAAELNEENQVVTSQIIGSFFQRLVQEEKSAATISKYQHDIDKFVSYMGNRQVTKELVIGYKQRLQEEGYAIRSVNSMLASVNRLLEFMGHSDCRVKSMKRQRQIYLTEEKELTKEEYMRLLKAAENQPQLRLILETICSTGIRVSELRFFTVEMVRKGEVIVFCKGKTRPILIPRKLKKILLAYAQQNHISSGILFRTRSGKPINRCSVWVAMKRLCARARVRREKVFPHNLRKLFARTFYRAEKDLAKLADLLGHSSIDTTRIYIMSTYKEHQRKIDVLGLVL